MEKVNDLKDIGKLSYSSVNRTFKRGDIYYIKGIEGTVDSEQKGTRPGVIISNDTGNKHSPNVLITYLTTADNKSPLPTHVVINSAQKQSIVLCECIKEISKSRVLEYVGKVADCEMEQINKALKISLALDNKKEIESIITDQIQSSNELIMEAERKKSEITDIQRRLLEYENTSVNELLNPNIVKALSFDSVSSISSIVNEMIQADKDKVEIELKKAIGIFKEEVPNVIITVDSRQIKDVAEEHRKVAKEVVEPSKNSEKKVITTTKKTEESSSKKKGDYDIGKILALKRAGWKVKDIADEFNVTPQVISNVLFKVKREQESKGVATC